VGKRKNRVKIEWSSNFAYAIGLIVSDGCVSSDGRHVSFTSQDEEQICNYLNALNIIVPRDVVYSGFKDVMAYRIQFSDVNFWSFLNDIGIHPAKSKTIAEVDLPIEFFFDFVRGVFDGDGCVYSYWDKRWKSSFMFYVSFVSASRAFVDWFRLMIKKELNIEGHISTFGPRKIYQLRYAKTEGAILISKMYEKKYNLHLSRKRLKINTILGTMSTTSARYSETST